MQVEIADQDLFDLTSFVYAKWAVAYDTLKAVKIEQPNRKLEPDWEQFHAIRLTNATAEEARLKAFLARMTAICPRIS